MSEGLSETRLRVVTLGAPEAAQRLRRSPEVEIVRTSDPLETIAELARPMAIDGPTRTAVVLDDAHAPESERDAFARAAREAAPGVMLLREGDGPADPRFDGSFGRESGAREILAAFENGGRRQTGASESPPETDPGRSRPAPEATDQPRSAGERAGEDRDVDPERRLLESILRGRVNLDEALAAASSRLRARAVFRRSVDSGSGEAVERRGRRYGVLSAPGADPSALRAEAAKLACVLAIDEQLSQLRAAAFVDDLTGAWNRGFFRRRLPRALEAAREGRRDVTLMIYDIDDFKQYNDEFGHGAGDEILRETVKLLRSVVRPTDLVCRIGGDEFAVIFDDPRADRDRGEDGLRGRGHQHPLSIAELARRFQRQVCEHRFPALAGDAKRTLTISGGMATFPWDAGDAEELVTAADRLLLESKRAGKNVITLGPGADRVCRVEFPRGV